MRRTFNYTGRKAIPPECIDASLTSMTGAPSLDVEFDFTLAPHIMDLPRSSRVYVDAWHDMSFMRFDHGVLGNPRPPESTLLTDLDTWTSVSFKVRIVEAGELLASSKTMTRTSVEPESRTTQKLIHHLVEDLGERPWLLRVSETMDTPFLVFNEKWWEACKASGMPLYEDRVAMAVVMPSVMQGMLDWLLIEQRWDHHLLHMERTWKGGWIQFARQLVKTVPPRPSESDDSEHLEDVREWINEVVEVFSARRGFTSTLVHVASMGED
jgi:hypothetical protein